MASKKSQPRDRKGLGPRWTLAAAAMVLGSLVLASSGIAEPGQEFEEFPPLASSTSLKCQSPVELNQGSVCTATVTGGVNPFFPRGQVTFVKSGLGFFSNKAASCAPLHLTGNKSRCQITYTPSSGNLGAHQITATYLGEPGTATRPGLEPSEASATIQAEGGANSFRVYVGDHGAGHQDEDEISVFSTSINRVRTAPIILDSEASDIAITPDGKRAYVTNSFSRSVSVINTATNTAEAVPGGAAIKVGIEPTAIAITPDGKRVYVTNVGSDTVSVINTVTNTAEGVPDGAGIKVGRVPSAIAIFP